MNASWRASGRALLAVALLGACATVPTGAPVTVSVAAPWALPESELGNQSLFRIQYGGERGDGALRAVLRLEAADRYQIAASDPLGRQVWTLSVAPERALWLDHRGRRACPVGTEIQIPDLGLPPLPLAAVPGLLLGRLPLVPGAGLAAAAGVEHAPNGEVRESDRRWSWRRGSGPSDRERLEAWTLYQNGTPVLWWRRDGDGGILSARRQGAQLRWQRVVSEPLTGPTVPPAPPADYRSNECDAVTLP
jgi:hypothetical protein